jgi:hypothetical protein
MMLRVAADQSEKLCLSPRFLFFRRRMRGMQEKLSSIGRFRLRL